MIERSKDVVIDLASHTYTHVETDSILRSVSKVYREYIPEFDAQNISWMMARKQLRQELVPGWLKGDIEPEEEAILAKQVEILALWKAKADNASGYGTSIHSVCEDIQNGIEVDDKYFHLVNLFKAEYGHYHKLLPEYIAHSMKYGVAGTIDNPMVRQKSSKSIIDIDDFKTNIEKGIVFDSIKIKDDGKLTHYNRFMLGPLSHLEDCNYNHYCMQQSIYGVLLELMFPLHKIGRITLTFIKEIDNGNARFDYEIERIPVAYLKQEAIAVLEDYSKKHPFVLKKKEILDDPDDY